MKKISNYKSWLVVMFAGFIFLATGCKSTDSAVDAELSKETEALLALLVNESYTIDVQTVRPFNTAATQRVVNNLLIPTTGNSAGRIDVRGQGHEITVKEGIVSGDLPFFGEQRQGGGHYGNADIGIRFNDSPKDYKVFRDAKRDVAMVTFTANHKGTTENYDVTMAVFPNKKAEVSIFSSHRTSIRYSGKLDFKE